MDDLLSLAEACERATGPDRELMCRAFRAVFPEVSSGALDAIDAWDAKYDRFCAMLDVGAHLDAAAMLVPEGFGHAVWAVIGKKPCASIQFASTTGLPPFAASADGWSDWSHANSAALALTAASLRARHSLLSTGGEG